MNHSPPKINPFPGLRPFTQEEDHLFFGREEQTLELLQRLENHRFVAVVGTSGSGKSSLVRCGLLSELQGGRMLGAGAAWEIAVTHPGGNPLALLTGALLDAQLYDREKENSRENLLATLSRSHFGLVEAVKQAGLDAQTNFLLVVDQFEEIFRFHEAGQTQQEMASEFVSLLLEAAVQKEVPIYIVLTMRSDFIGECGQFEGLAETVNRGEFLIPRLTREQYKRVIEGPIKVAGGQIAPRLLQRLLNDLGQQADQLPCLQHALMRTWNVWTEKGDADALDLEDYQRVGKMAEALSLHADEIYDALATDRQRQLCRGLFQALTVQESENRGIRRPQRLGRLCQILDVPAEELLPIIDAYRGHGVTFLMPPQDVELTERTIIDISHESLMRVWTRLRHWVEEEAQAAGIYLRLSESAALHAQGKAGLYRDPELGIALAWQESQRPNAPWAERYRGGFDAAMAFLKSSQEAGVAEERAREAARQRELEQARELAEAQQLRLGQQQRAARKLRKMIAGVAIVALIAALACVAAIFANRRAKNALAVVASQKAAVEGSLSKAEAAERVARAAVEEGRQLQYTTDMQLAPFVWKDGQTTAEQLRILLAKHVPYSSAAVAPPDLRGFEWYYDQHLLDSSAAVFSVPGDPIVNGVITSNGQLLSVSEKGQLRRWDVNAQAEDEASRLDLPGRPSDGEFVFSRDGGRAALASGNKIHLFDTHSGKETVSIDSADGVRRLLCFWRDGSVLVIIDDKIRWCDSKSGEVIASFDRKLDSPRYAGVSADGLTLAVGGYSYNQRNNSGNSIYRLDLAAKKVTRVVEIPFGTISTGALAPNGKWLALSFWFGGGTYVFDTATGGLIAQNLTAHASRISSMVFSDDSANLASGDDQGTVKIWADVDKIHSKSAALRTLKGHRGEIGAMRFSTDGKRLFTASRGGDAMARVWDLESNGTASRPVAGRSPAARLSPDGLLIADASDSGIQLWDAATGRLVRQSPTGNVFRAHSVAFSPTDKRLLAVGSESGTDQSYVALWDIDAGIELARLPGATDLPAFKIDSGTGAIGALAFSPDGKYLVGAFGGRIGYPERTTNTSYPLKVWDVATRRLIHRLDGHTFCCTSLDFSRDGKLLVSGGLDEKAIIWSTSTWNATQTLGTSRAVFSTVFSPDGKTLGVGHDRGDIQWWDAATGHLLEEVNGHATSIPAMVFSPDGLTLATGSEDQTVRLWNAATRRQLMQLDPGSVELGTVQTLEFSPDGRQLLAGGTSGSVIWSAAPMLWNDPERAAAKLRLLLRSNADFKNRIRMFSENLRLHEALSKLDSKDARVQAALAAAQANWHASRQEWTQAVVAFDRLVAADPTAPDGWLRTPGLLRLATALLQQDRPADAAMLLKGGQERLWQDGLPPISRGDATGDLFFQLLEAVEKRLAKNPRDAGLLELRAELAAQQADVEGQVADYTTAINILAEQPAAAVSARLRRLYCRRGDAYLSLQKWQQAIDDYAHVITPETTDIDLLSNRARAQEALQHWDAAAADWSRAASGNPQEARWLAEFAHRLAAVGQIPLAEATHTKALALVEVNLAKQPENAALAAELANVLLDRFRPAVSTDPADLARENKRLAAMKLTDPWLRLAVAYAVNGRKDQTLQYISRAIKEADRFEAMKPIIEAAVSLELLEKLAEQAEDNGHFQAGLARHYSEQGNAALADAARTRARSLFEDKLAAEPENSALARELTQLLLDEDEKNRVAGWTVLKPVEAKSTLGATLSILPDDSILASGANPSKDLYRVVLTIGKNIDPSAVRLELLTHPSLPGKGPGRQKDGTCALSSWKVTASSPDQKDPVTLEFNDAWADHQHADYPIRPDGHWNIWGGHGGNCTAIWSTSNRVSLAAGATLTFEMQCQQYNDAGENLGRFRLSVAGDPAAIDRERKRLTVTKLVDPWERLAAVCQLSGDQKALDSLLKHHPTAAVGIAELYAAAGRTREAVPYLAKASANNPADTILSLKVAALQAWFGQEKELAATRRQILAFAKDTSEVTTADRAAKACSILPSADKAEVEAALALGRKAVEIDKAGAWNLLALGMAEYRAGNYAVADQALFAAGEAGKDIASVTGVSAFYRAMNLFRQGKPDEARRIAIAIAASMKPLPADEKNPLAGNANQDDLVLWLAYKEAKELIRF